MVLLLILMVLLLIRQVLVIPLMVLMVLVIPLMVPNKQNMTSRPDDQDGSGFIN